MRRETLLALSPLDGRYRGEVAELAEEFSECALIVRRIEVEVKWLVALLSEPAIVPDPPKRIDRIAKQIIDAAGVGAAEKIKKIEEKTRHDVKAVEMWLVRRLAKTPLAKHRALVHFGCTSWDINNICYALMLRAAAQHRIAPALLGVADALAAMARRHAKDAMLARTHGQPASPTTMGKECAVFARRLRRLARRINDFKFGAKMNGASGNYDAHCIAYPDADWRRIARRFVESLGLAFNPLTTQIEPYDDFAEFFHLLIRANNAALDLCRDFWGYISLDYFRQRAVKDEVGSSAMPHKVNPIDFENAEGNLGLASALLNHFAMKLPVSRFQRDLSDSTVIRNFGAALGHCLLAYRGIARGLEKIELNRGKLAADLDANWQVLAEAAQSVLRARGDEKGYETLRKLTRGGGAFNQAQWQALVDKLNLPPADKETLRKLTPAKYIGLAPQLARDAKS